jgi:hypothetical protein
LKIPRHFELYWNLKHIRGAGKLPTVITRNVTAEAVKKKRRPQFSLISIESYVAFAFDEGEIVLLMVARGKSTNELCAREHMDPCEARKVTEKDE